jgi:flagellar hook-length control protein FliK
MTDAMPDITAAPSGLSDANLAPVNGQGLFSSPGNNNESLIDRQIQSILHGNDPDAITIQTPSQRPVTAESLNGLTSPHLQSAEADTVSTQATIATVPNQAVTSEVSGDTAESLREDMGKHAADAKIEPLKDQRHAGNQQQSSGQQENSANQQNNAGMPMDVSHGNSEPISQFIVTGLGTQTAATTPGHTAAAHSANLPSGMPVPAEEVINHLVERFSINPRLQTSKVSLSLNPAELGELKIDIMVKGDSIKAHIAAGSQQIQETIERHMPKLKTVLEQQGFTVEDFQVTLESATTDSHDFFQQQFSSRRDSTPQAAAVPGQSSFEASLNSAEELLIGSMDSGINLNI